MSAAIRVTNLGKRYRLGQRTQASKSFAELLMHGLTAPWRRWRQLRETADGEGSFWALREITFDVTPGEVIGIIGQNGAGKSTLLKILSRITTPTTGRVELHGKVRSLLEVGTGFHPELTGRENIYLNGAILGMSRREIAAQFDAIVDYAGIERFLDTPVKRYSSGMYVRLAFAVAAHLQPEILIIDEVLAVGDAAFQRKCLGTMRDVAAQGRTVLFVSHNMAAMTQLCTRGILLDQGQVHYEGKPQDAVHRYLGANNPDVASVTYEVEDRPVQITSATLCDARGNAGTVLRTQSPIDVEIAYRVRDWPTGAYLAVLVTTEAGIDVLWSCDTPNAASLAEPRKPGEHRVTARIPANTLAPGSYVVSIAIYHPVRCKAVDHRPRCLRFTVEDQESLIAYLGLRPPALLATPLAWSTHPPQPCEMSDEHEVATIFSNAES
jgi:lipopolysaccharide transport system ATP-binding protein